MAKTAKEVGVGVGDSKGAFSAVSGGSRRCKREMEMRRRRIIAAKCLLFQLASGLPERDARSCCEWWMVWQGGRQ